MQILSLLPPLCAKSSALCRPDFTCAVAMPYDCYLSPDNHASLLKSASSSYDRKVIFGLCVASQHYSVHAGEGHQIDPIYTEFLFHIQSIKTSYVLSSIQFIAVPNLNPIIGISATPFRLSYYGDDEK